MIEWSIIYFNIYSQESIAFASTGFRIHDQLNVINFSKRFENTAKHIFCNIKM